MRSPATCRPTSTSGTSMSPRRRPICGTRSTQPSRFPPAPIACGGSGNGKATSRSSFWSDVVTESSIAKAQSILDRFAAIDWCQPAHDPPRAAAAYEAWLETLGLRRRVRWVEDPADVEAWRTQAASIANPWITGAAAYPWARSLVGWLLNSAAEPPAARWSPPSLGAAD